MRDAAKAGNRERDWPSKAAPPPNVCMVPRRGGIGDIGSIGRAYAPSACMEDGMAYVTTADGVEIF